MGLIRLFMCVAGLVAVASPALAGDAKGRFVVKGGKTSGTIAPTQAAAFVARDPRDARNKVAEVVLSDEHRPSLSGVRPGSRRR